jgi:hypothetical protein
MTNQFLATATWYSAPFAGGHFFANPNLLGKSLNCTQQIVQYCDLYWCYRADGKAKRQNPYEYSYAANSTLPFSEFPHSFQSYKSLRTMVCCH